MAALIPAWFCVYTKDFFLQSLHLGFSEVMLTHFCGKRTCFAIFVTFSQTIFFKTGLWIEGFPPLRGSSLWIEFRTLSISYWDRFHQGYLVNEPREVDTQWRQMNLILPTNLDLDLLMRKLMHCECLKSTLFALTNFIAIMCEVMHWGVPSAYFIFIDQWVMGNGRLEAEPDSKKLAWPVKQNHGTICVLKNIDQNSCRELLYRLQYITAIFSHNKVFYCSASATAATNQE